MVIKMLLYMCLASIEIGVNCHVSCASVTIATEACCRAGKTPVYVQMRKFCVKERLFVTLLTIKSL